MIKFTIIRPPIIEVSLFNSLYIKVLRLGYIEISTSSMAVISDFEWFNNFFETHSNVANFGLRANFALHLKLNYRILST